MSMCKKWMYLGQYAISVGILEWLEGGGGGGGGGGQSCVHIQ